MTTRYGWWRTYEHFCVPGSAPEAISRQLDLLEHHVRANTSGFRKQPVVGIDEGNGWQIAYVAKKTVLEDLRDARPDQADKYDRARAGGFRGNLGPIPPVDQTSIDSIDLDAAPAAQGPRIWMEIRRESNTDGFGENLYAYRYKEDGTARPAFARLGTVQPGDLVLHYWMHAIRGVSVIEGAPEVLDDGITTTLRDMVWFTEPVTLDDLRDRTLDIVDVYHDTRDDPQYRQFPFQIDHASSADPNLHGAAVTYFVAFPSSLVDAVPLLATQFTSAVGAQDKQDRSPDDTDARVVRRARGPVDPLLRRRIEVYAEDQAIELLKSEGYTEIERIGKPYDLLATGPGIEDLHVEVKGSMLTADAVILTRNEVSHADDHVTSLIVVDEIVVEVTEDGYQCSGGRLRRWGQWRPEPEALEPLEFAYHLPVDAVTGI